MSETARIGDCEVGQWVKVPRKRTRWIVWAQSDAKTYLKRPALVGHGYRIDWYDEVLRTDMIVSLAQKPDWITASLIR